MKTEIQGSEASERLSPYETKIKVFSAVAWFCVILGFLAIVPGVCHLVSESNADKNPITLSSLSSLGSYTSLVRATLSQFELALLFYNGVSDNGEKFKPLIEEFGLLENFDRDVLYDKAEDEKLYAPEAFI